MFDIENAFVMIIYVYILHKLHVFYDILYVNDILNDILTMSI